MSNFICEKCGITNIDCGHQGYKTEREIELEKQLGREIKINRKMKEVLKNYADKTNWRSLGEIPKYNEVWIFTDCKPNEVGFESAQQVLKEIDNKE